MPCTISYIPIGKTEPIILEEAEFIVYLATPDENGITEYQRLIDKGVELPPITPPKAPKKESAPSEGGKKEEEHQALLDDVITGEPKEIGKNLKAFIYAMNSAEGVSVEQKKTMNETLGEYYETLSNEELIALGKDIVEAYGGLNKALKAVDKATDKEMPPYLKLYILGEGVLASVKEQEEAKTEKEKNDAADDNNELIDKIDNLLRDAGRTIQFVKHLYKRTNLAVTRTISGIVKERNEANMPQAEATVKGVMDILKEEDDISGAAKETFEQQLNDKSKELEEAKLELEKLKKQLTNTTPPKNTGKKVDLGIGKTKAKEALDRLKNKRYNASQKNIIPISLQEIQDLTDYIGSQIEEGAESFEDIYDKANKELGGEYSDYYADAYKKARDLAQDKGSKNKYSNNDEVDSVSDTKQAESDAEKLIKATEKEAKAAIDKAKKADDAPKTAARRIVSDAKTMSGLPTTKKEAELLNQIIAKVAEKARENMANKGIKAIPKTPIELIEFALKNAKEGEKIFSEAKKEVEAIIKADKNLTQTQKDNLNQFLDKYQKSIFENLLSNKNKDSIIKEALIAAGYAKEDNKGNITVDFSQLAFRGKSVQETIDKIKEKILATSTLTEQELAPIMESIKKRLEATIAEKKANKINSFIKSKNRIGSKGRKLRIDKLIELYKAGGFSNKDVLNHLAEDLGIITFTAEQQKYVEELLGRIDKAAIGSLKAIEEEELQAFFEHIGGTFATAAFHDKMRSNLLSSVITAIKNLSGFGTTFSTVLFNLLRTNIQGSADANVARIVKRALSTGKSLAFDVILNGGQDTGSAFAELTGQKEGTPSVRRLEPKFSKYRNFLLPDLNVTIAGKQINLNFYNALSKSLFVVGRGLAAPDSFNHTILLDVESYSAIKSQLMVNNPNMSSKEAAKMAYEIAYSKDMTDAIKQANKEFAYMGKVKDMSTVAGRAVFNRRVNEILQQKRDAEVLSKANKQASIDTFKQADLGLMSGIGMGVNGIKSALSRTIPAMIRKWGRGTPMAKTANRTASAVEASSEAFFSATVPFISGAANILEKQLELFPPYGLAKGAIYMSPLAFSKSVRNDSTARREAVTRGSRYIFRAILGLAYMQIFLALADTDDEEEDEKGKKGKKIYGTGDRNRNKNILIGAVNPENTIIIGGHAVPMDLVGGMAVSLRIEGLMGDFERYYEKNDLTVGKEAQMIVGAIISSSITKGLMDVYDKFSNPSSPAAQNFFYKKVAEYSTRAMIPFTSLARAAEQAREPEAKKAVTVMEIFLKQGGIVSGWALDRPAYDILGNTYNNKDMYTASAAGTMNVFSKRETVPLLEWSYRATGADATISNVNKMQEAYMIVNKETGELEAMSDIQYYDFGLLKAKTFGELLGTYYDKHKDRKITDETKKITKDDISNLNEISKSIAYSALFSGASAEDRIKEESKKFYNKTEESQKNKAEIKEKHESLKITEQEKELYDMKNKDWGSFKYNNLLPKLIKSNSPTTQLRRWKELDIINFDERTDLEKQLKK